MPTCLITATNRGIGFELARAALDKGWRVYGSVRSGEAARLSEDAHGTNYQALHFDVTDHEAVTAAAEALTDKIDLLINNAGIIGPQRQTPTDMDFHGFQETLSINTIAPLAVTNAFLPHLRRSGSGRVLTISSQMSWMGYRKSDRLAYRASKAAVNKVMQGLATELEREHIPVALVDPGWVRTDMGGADADHAPEDVARGVLKIADRLTIKDTGKFFKWSGEERPF